MTTTTKRYEHANVKMSARGARHHLVLERRTPKSPLEFVARCEHEGMAMRIALALNAQEEK